MPSGRPRQSERLAKAEGDVFGGVMRIDMRIALAGQGQIKPGPERRQGEHVIKQAKTGGDGRLAAAFKAQGQIDIGLRRGSGDVSGTDHAPPSSAAFSRSAFFLPTSTATQMLTSYSTIMGPAIISCENTSGGVRMAATTKMARWRICAPRASSAR